MNEMTSTSDVSLKLNDRTLFGNDAGEDENIEVLASYFVNQAAFNDFLDIETPLSVARARKGMGKSALLSKFAHDLEQLESKPLVVQVVPSSLSALIKPPESGVPSEFENYWKQVICQSINMEIAKTIGFAWKDDQISLVENAELNQFKGRNIIGALASRLLGKISIGNVAEIQQSKPSIANYEQLLKRIQEEENSNRSVWFLLDDIDTKFTDTPQQQAYVSSFFSACRSLIRDIEGLSIRATVRTDVWTSLRAAEDLDKFEQYVCDIVWTKKQQRDILIKRIYAYIMRKHKTSYVAKNWDIDTHGEDYIQLAFKRRLKWGNSGVPAVHVLQILSAGRPRWMAQLCRLAGNKAVDNGSTRIGVHEINEVMIVFGTRRLSDLYKEHSHQFADLQKLIEAFSNGARRYTTDELFKKIINSYIKLKSAKTIPDVDGSPFRDAWQIAHFLFKCGFIVGHNQAETSLDVPEFISYELRPDLLQTAVNLDDGLNWEIQPSYRRALRIQ
ncbi:hypothetical protein VXJ36_09200 [Pseudomonas nitroreducens]|uniref:P-loop ATPase, Sll1717 family n=1 Tax=Pseudomonas nitroreducens TaxID=46680 RepID=UPI002F35124B